MAGFSSTRGLHVGGYKPSGSPHGRAHGIRPESSAARFWYEHARVKGLDWPTAPDLVDRLWPEICVGRRV
jgi:hypothetical protein